KEYENNAVFTDFKKISPYYMGKMDLWYGFACIGLDLLRNKGKLCFIASSQWRTSASAKILRNKICNEAKIIQLIDFGAYMVFETSTQAMILIISKDSIDNNYDFLFKVNNQTIKNNHMLNIFLAERFFHLDFNRIEYRNKMFSFVINMSYKNILDKIEKIGNFKIDDKKEIIQGIIGGPDKAFKVKNKNISLFSKAEQAFIQPFYTTTVSYYTPIAKDSILYISDKNIEDFSSEKYPNIYKKLLKYSAELEGRREVVAGKKSWFSLWWERDESFFKDGKKIVFASRTRGRNFTYTEDKFYASRNCFILKSERINLKYLTALLNSKILTFYMHNKLKKNGDLLQLDKAQFTLMPLYCPDNNIQDKVSDIVTKIIATKKECINSDITIYEQKIDEVIYKLYGLTPKEIVIVESNLSI
ncbi:Eco57I restriction-modification methylase domain-containing protein, partial [Treponema socranskii]